MLKNHLLIALRHLFGNKGYFFINTLGLSTGIACSLLVFLFVRQEWTFDTFHEKADQIYRVNVSGQGFDGTPFRAAITPVPLGPALKSQFPGVVETVRIRTLVESVVRVGDDTFREDRMLTCDPSFFQVFSFPLIEGDPEAVFTDFNALVISRTMAEKYFGGESALGRQLTIGDEPYTVTGVAEDSPANSSIQFDFLLPFDRTLGMSPWLINAADSWNHSLTFTYAELEDPQQAAPLREQLPGFSSAHFSGQMSRALEIQALADIHLDPGVTWGMGTASDPNRSYILISTALLVLFIACVNFMNLAICRSSARAKEVGLRKVFGAQQSQIAGQHLGESLVLSGFALVLGVVLAHLFLPIFNSLLGKSLVLDYLSSVSTLAALLAFTLLVAFVSGSYPSLVLSRFNPVAILRRQVQVGGPNLLIRGLMVLQFGLSAALVVSILVMTRQLDFARTGDLGYNTENIVVIEKEQESGNLDVFRNRVLPYEGVLRVTGVSNSFGPDRGLAQAAYADSVGNRLEAFMYTVDYDYVKTLELNLVSGRDFSREFGADETGSCIINEAAAASMGWDDPIGRTLPHGVTVIGVVEDYHYRSMHHEIEPVILTLNPVIFGEKDQIRFFLVRVSDRDLAATLGLLRAAWTEVAPGSLFEYFFLDDDIGRFYVEETNLARIFTYSAVFALLIACLGVYGLVSLEVARRTREVGIRKVMGAAVSDIMGLLSKQFVYLVLIANVLAWPAAWWLMNEWLADFAYRADIGVWPFLASGLVVLAITLLTVSLQTSRSALLNPADTLRRD